MRNWMYSALAGAMALSMGGCPDGPVVESEGIFLAPRTWSQYGCDGESSSFNAVHTTFAVAPLRKWQVQVGELSESGPAIGPDGTIYVGTVAGDLVAIAPDGVERWRLHLSQEAIMSTPVVDADTGDIYFVGQLAQEDGFVSRLHRASSAGQLRSPSSENFSSVANPKIWKNFIFLMQEHDLFVFDKNSMATVSRLKTGCINVICGGPTLPGDIFEGLLCVGSLFTTELSGLTDCFPGFNPTPAALNSVAIVDNEKLVGNAEQPVIVITNDQCVSAVRFHPAGDVPAPFDPHFEPLWSHALVAEDCDFDTVFTSSPSVIDGGQVVFGVENQVRSLDVMTGAENWRTDIGDSLAHPPVAAIRQIYLSTFDGRLVVLDSDGDLLSESHLQGSGRGVALSLDFVYVGTPQGLHTFTLDPKDGFVFEGTINSSTHFGSVTPAIGEDGTVYVSTPNGFLHAYASGGILQKPIRVPQINWEGLADGALLSVASAPELSAAVIGADGGEFIGTVAFASDVDGLLCQVFAANGRAACTPEHPLSPGTHHLSAFALDESGGANSALITIEVLNSAPVVTITPTLQTHAIPQATDVLHLAASVTDAEESLTDAQIRWRSSISGEIGHGAAIDVSLPAGLHTITVTATDSFGATGEASTQIQVEGNSPPIVELVTPVDGAIFVAEDLILFTVMVDDLDESEFDLFHVIWNSSLDGELGNGLILRQHLSVGTHEISVTATDLAGAATTRSVTIQVNP